MSVFGALNSAASGLHAQSSALGNISDNIANTRTVGYKRVDTSFNELVTSSNSMNHQPGGVSSAPAYRNNVQGPMEQSQVGTHMAINGPGFFSVSQPDRTDPSGGNVVFGNNTYYTRAGDFELDKNGYLVNSAGYYLNGWAINQNTGVVDTSAVTPIRISQLVDAPVATNQVQYAANLPASVEDGTELPPNSIQIYDHEGNQRTLEFHWSKTSQNEWELEIRAPGATTAAFGPSTFTFQDGRISAVSAGGGLTGPTDQAAGDPIDMSLSLDYGGGMSAQPITINLGNFTEASGTTQFAGTELVLNSFDQNGVPAGAYQSVTVDERGYVTLNFDNGKSKTFYQVPLVQFYNPNGLQRLQGSAFQQTPESGVPRLNPPGLGSNGTVSANSLEQANVDITDEFSKMIVAQRTYSANARIISTSDDMLQEVINLRR